MTETQTISEETATVSLDDLNYFWSEDGIPVFYANREDICDVVENLGFNIYYLLSNKIVKPTQTNNKNNNNNKNGTTGFAKAAVTPAPDKKTFACYKVCNSFVGRTVQESSFTFQDDFVLVNPSAHYTMPLIPTVIVDKLDQFFRLVDAQHGTESIVMLTYDMDKTGPEGWGVLVPDQENTAAHCNYDPHSIAEIKPDNVMIVGSVHSHPKMSAYASGTDHADQADFDGIHITYGWQKSVNNGATQYHLELQMAGEAYTLQPEDVFEDYVRNTEPDPEVVEWSSKVKKELPPLYNTGGILGTPNTKTTTTPQTGPVTGRSSAYNAAPSWDKTATYNSIRDQLETPCLVAVEIDTTIKDAHEKAKFCTMCEGHVDNYDLVDHSCYFCGIPIFPKDTPLSEVLSEVAYYANTYKVKLDIPVYLVGRDNATGLFVSKLTDNLQNYVNGAIKQTDLYDDEEYYLSASEEYVCCNTDSITEVCGCEYPLNLEEFNNLISTDLPDLYSREPESQCLDCDNYNNENCPYLVDILAKYKDLLINSYDTAEAELTAAEESIQGINCEHFELYNYNALDVNDEKTYQDEYTSYYHGGYE